MKTWIAAVGLTAGLLGVAHAELLTNRGFETGDLTGWAAFGQGWRTSIGSDARDETYGVVNDVLETDGDAFRGIFQNVPVQEGASYSAATFIRAVNTESSASWMEVQWLDASGGIIQQVTTPAVVADQPFTLSRLPLLVAPFGAVTASVRGIVQMFSAPVTNADFHAFDSFSFVQHAPGLLANRSLESGDLSGWVTFGQGWRASTGGDAASGLYGAINDVLTTDADEFRGLLQNVPVTPGVIYAAAVSIRAVTVESSESWLEVQWLDINSQVIGQDESERVTVDQPFIRTTLTDIEAPAGAVTASVRAIVFMPAAPTTDTDFHNFDDFIFQPATSVEIVRENNGSTMIRWPATAWRDVLEFTTNITQPGAWLPVPDLPADVSNRWVISHDADSPTASYRLNLP